MKLLIIALSDFRRLTRDRLGLAMLMGMPVFLLVVMYFTLGPQTASRGVRGIPVAIQDLDRTKLSQRITTELSRNTRLKLEEHSEASAARVSDYRLVAIITIPSGFEASVQSGRPLPLGLRHRPGSPEALVAREEIADTAAKVISAQVSADIAVTTSSAPQGADWQQVFERVLGRWSPSPPVTVTSTVFTAEGRKLDTRQAMAATASGFMVMAVFMSVSANGASMLEERQRGTWARLLTTPVARWELLAGKTLGCFLVGWAQAAFLLTFGGKYGLGLHWGDNPAGVWVLLTAFIAVAASIGMFLGTCFSTMAQAGPVLGLVVTASCMLGGAFWPIEFTPPVMQAAAKFVPTRWAVAGLNSVIAKGATLADVMPHTLVLLGFGLGFYVLGALRVQRWQGR